MPTSELPPSINQSVKLSQRFNEKILLTLIVFLGVFLRLYKIDGFGLWVDEFATLMIDSKSSLLQIIKTCFHIPQPLPPVFFVFNKLCYELIGHNETGLRFLSVLSSSITIYLVFLLGKKLFDSKIGLFCAFIFSVDSFQLFHAHNARPYALALLWCSISMLSYLQIHDRPKSKWLKIIYLSSTMLLFYTHYIFLFAALLQNLHFFWLRFTQEEAKERTKSWAYLQTLLGLSLLPLTGQFYKVFGERKDLNWATPLFPTLEKIWFFFDAQVLLVTFGFTILIWGLMNCRRSKLLGPEQNAGLSGFPQKTSSFFFLFIWYFVPILFFYGLAWTSGSMLFVDRYLIMCSIPAIMLIPVLASRFLGNKLAIIFMIVYCVSYVGMIPCPNFKQRGQFAKSPPGGNQWREALPMLQDPRFQSPLVLLQAVFVESNQLNFKFDPEQVDYFASPYRSFYVQKPLNNCELLPYLWHLDIPQHQRLRQEMRELITQKKELVLFSTNNYWENFSAWLQQEFSKDYTMQEVVRFESSGVISIRKIRLTKTNLEAPAAIGQKNALK
jgi:hypothetical protein